MADQNISRANQSHYGMLIGDNDSRGGGIGSNETNDTAIMVDDHDQQQHEHDDTEPGMGSIKLELEQQQHGGGGSSTGAGEEPSFNLKLIDVVKQNHCLYDASDRQYRSADYKIKIWNRLVQLLGFQGDARTLYNRWKQLRDKYGKEKKKLKYSGEQHSQWQYFKYLTWLNPHMIDRTQLRYERNRDGKNDQRQIVITDPNFTLHLINEVRLQPCLYDIKDPKYRHTEYRNQAWAEIVKNLAFPGDVNALYKQWKKVRDRYVREKRKLRMTSSAEQEEPNWELYRELIWIDPYLEERAAQVKRKRESSELSCDEGSMFNMNDTFSSTLNSSGLNELGGENSQQNQLDQHQQHYGMLAGEQQQQHVTGEGGMQHIVVGGHQLHQLVKLQQSQQQQQQLCVPLQQQNLARLRPTNCGTPSSLIGVAGLVTSAAAATTVPLMMPNIQGQQQLSLPLASHIQQQIAQQQQAQAVQVSSNNNSNPASQQQQQQQQHLVIRNNEQQQAANAVTIDGDRAFAISVAADLLCLPEHARQMARAQIQHLLENSKITIVKA